MEEWQHIITQKKAFIFCEDFNAHSTLWGYRDKGLRGDFLTKHLVVHNLTIANLHNCDATFEKLINEVQVTGATGYPDSPWLTHRLSPTHSGSDHKYIHYTYYTRPLHTQRRRFNTTRGNFHKFNNIIKFNKQALHSQLININSTDKINEFATKLIEMMHTAAKASFRLKSVHKTQ